VMRMISVSSLSFLIATELAALAGPHVESGSIKRNVIPLLEVAATSITSLRSSSSLTNSGMSYLSAPWREEMEVTAKTPARRIPGFMVKIKPELPKIGKILLATMVGAEWL